jgi:hypothetical protein
MTALTVRLPDEKHRRLKALAKSRGTPLNRLIDDMTTVILAEFDAETRFRLRALRGAVRSKKRWACSCWTRQWQAEIAPSPWQMRVKTCRRPYKQSATSYKIGSEHYLRPLDSSRNHVPLVRNRLRQPVFGLA